MNKPNIAQTKEQIKKMPKVVLHLHLDGSLRPEFVQQEVQKILGRPVPFKDIKKRLMVEKDCRDLNQYLEKFDIPVKVLQSKAQIERATFELYEDLARQGVVYAEVRFAPSKHLLGGLSYDEVVEASVRGLNRAKETYDIDGNIILCCIRGEENKGDKKSKKNREANEETVKVAKRFLGKGVCAIDLAGAEALFPTKDFEYIFKMARDNNIPFTIHAGEADGPRSIKKALKYGAKRIGHGVRCIDDRGLMKKLKDEGIVLEICPTSNLQTQAVHGKHPLEEIYRSGIKTTISTDNNTVSNTDILQEYEWVLRNTKLNLKDLLMMNIYATQCIFGTAEQKKAIEGRILDFINQYGEQSCEASVGPEMEER